MRVLSRKKVREYGEANAQAKEDVADTKKSLSADEQFLMMLKEKPVRLISRARSPRAGNWLAPAMMTGACLAAP